MVDGWSTIGTGESKRSVGDAIFGILGILVMAGLLGGFIWLCVKHEANLRNRPYSQSYQMLEGRHQLRKLTTSTSRESEISGGFFLIAGGMSGSSKDKRTVTFSWENVDNEYIISTIPVEKIRIKLDEKVEAPYVTFNHEASPKMERSIQTEIDFYLNYATFTCKPSDWVIDINMPLEREQ